MKVAVLISGRGSNLEALMNDQNGYQITHVVTNNLEANGLNIARKKGIKNTYINWVNRNKAEEMLIDLLEEIKVDLVILAGFMRILSTKTVNAIPPTINIHPSLLPKYPGLNTHQKVIDNADINHGATVHVVNNKLDGGLILGQISFRVNKLLTAEQLADELISKEHKLLITVVGLIAKKKLSWKDNMLLSSDEIPALPIQINDL